MKSSPEIGLYVGIDWADQKHDYHLLGENIDLSGQVAHDIEQLETWIQKLSKLAAGKTIAIAVEQKRGSLFNALVKRENIVLYPIDPGKAASYRKSFSKEAKTDAGDALYLAKMLRERIGTLEPFAQVAPLARKIHETARLRRSVVDERTRIKLKLLAELKACFPLILQLFGSVNSEAAMQILKRWPTQRLLKKAHARSIRCALSDGGVSDPKKQDELIKAIRDSKLFCQDHAIAESHDLQVKLCVSQIRLLSKAISDYDLRLKKLVAEHPDAALFLSIKGVGPVAAARLVAAFEFEAPQCPTADHLSARAGIAPVPNSSGKQSGKRHLARHACNRYLKQTFHEFVDKARLWCVWTKARYLQLRAKKMKHAAAIRKIARSWIRILFRIWQTKEPFDSQRYLKNILARNPELRNFIPQNNL